MSDTPRDRTDDEVNEASAESFPASDPPSFTPVTSSIADRVPGAEPRRRNWRMMAAVPAAIGGLIYMIRRARRRTLG